MKKKLKVLVLFDGASPTKIDQDFSEELKTPDWKAEKDVTEALTNLGHTAEHLVLYDDVDLVRQKLETFAPDVIFNLVEQFKNNPGFDQNIVSFFEMQGLPFTGCGSTGLTLCKHKGISKNIVGYHGIRVPNFAVIPRGQRAGTHLKRLKFPVLVKPLKDEASYGISQASFVQSEEQLRDRVAFIHEKHSSDAIAEEYIEGRELYVSIIGNVRLTVFPIRELIFREVPPNEPKIATFKAKWDEEYRKRWGLEGQFADVDPALTNNIEETCKRIYRLLTIDGYARIDLRLTPANELYFIEANPNPHLAADEDFAQSATKAGLDYPQLIERIARQGMNTSRD